MSANAFRHLAGQLKQGSLSLQSTGNQTEILTSALQASKHLQVWANVLEHGSKAQGSLAVDSKHFSAECLLRSVMLSLQLRGGGGRLQEVVQNAMMLALPSEVFAGLRSSVEQSGHKLPSKSTIKAHYLTLDLAISLFYRHLWDQHRAENERLCHYLYCDSSPQLGMNLLWVCGKTVRRSLIVTVMEAAWVLIERLKAIDWREERAAMDIVLQPDILQASGVLRDNIHPYVHVPVVLGSATASAADEANAMVHAIAMTVGAYPAKAPGKGLCPILIML
eukprot:6492757-Amphidinium_carterae.1